MELYKRDHQSETKERQIPSRSQEIIIIIKVVPKSIIFLRAKNLKKAIPSQTPQLSNCLKK